jgi:superfamily II DNA or RNA helicase
MPEINYAKMKLDFEHVHIYPYNNVNVIVASLNDEFMLQIKSHFTLRKENYQFTPAYKSGNWDGNIRFIWKNGLMPRGLLKECIQELQRLNIPFKISKELLPYHMEVDDFEEVTKKTLMAKQEKPLEPYAYQWDVAKRICRNEIGVARAATSAGKTFMTALALNYLFEKEEVTKVLVIVPSIMLVVQMRENFVDDYGMDKSMVGMYMGREKDSEPPIVVGTWQSLMNIEDKKFFKQFDMVVVDECHKANKGAGTSKKDRSILGGSQIKQILDKCTRAVRRIGVTGTLPTNDVDVKTVLGCLGPILVEVTARDLMDKGHITDLQIVTPIIGYDMTDCRPKIETIKSRITKEWAERRHPKPLVEKDMKMIRFHAERQFLESYIPRFKYMTSLVKKRLQKDENVLILVHSVEYGANLVKVLRKRLKDATYVEHVHGDINLDVRNAAIKSMEENTKCVIVATMSIFGTGVSIKNLHTVIFGSTTKAKISVLQAIGRSLRKHESKKRATVIDIVDDLPYAQRHATERMSYYEEEGFDIKFVEVTI